MCVCVINLYQFHFSGVNRTGQQGGSLDFSLVELVIQSMTVGVVTVTGIRTANASRIVGLALGETQLVVVMDASTSSLTRLMKTLLIPNLELYAMRSSRKSLCGLCSKGIW